MRSEAPFVEVSIDPGHEESPSLPERDGDEWYTPSSIVEAAREVLGSIDLDPASCDWAQGTVKATTLYTKETDGLAHTWDGRVFCNPPYSKGLIGQFAVKLMEEVDAGRTTAGLFLVNNSHETRWCAPLLKRFPRCQLTGRVQFYGPNKRGEGAKNQPRLGGSTIFYTGPDLGAFVRVFEPLGPISVPVPVDVAPKDTTLDPRHEAVPRWVGESPLVGIIPTIAYWPRNEAKTPRAPTGPLIPVMSDAYAVSFPWLPEAKAKNPDKPPTDIVYAQLSEVLTTQLDCDAHYAAYSSPGIKHRLNTSLLSDKAHEALASAGVLMVLFVADVDTPNHVLATDEWCRSEHPKLAALLAKHPGAFIYRTKHGYRIVYQLNAGIMLHNATDAAAWSRRYEAWVAHLATFGIVADPACKDWTRLYRAPHVERDGVETIAYETLGDPSCIGRWVCDVEVPAVASVESSGVEYQPAGDWALRVEPAVAWLREAASIEGKDFFKDTALYLTATHFRLPVDTAAGLILDTVNARRKAKGKTEYTLGETRRQVSNAATSAWAQGVYKKEAADLAAFPNWSKAQPANTEAPEPAPAEPVFTLHRGVWEEALPEVPWTVHGLIPSATVGMLVAPGDSMKTWLAMSLLLAVGAGTAWLGRYKVTQGAAYFVDLEADLHEAHRRLQVLKAGSAPGFIYANTDRNLHDEEFWKNLPKDGAIYVVDSLSAGSGGVDENTVAAALPLKFARRFVKATGAVVLFLHHTKKGEGNARDKIRGSSALFNDLDVAYGCEAEEPSETGARVSNVFKIKMRRAKAPAPFDVMLSDDGGLQIIGDGSPAPVDYLVARVLDFIRGASEAGNVINKDSVAAAVKGRRSKIYEVVNNLLRSKQVIEIGPALDMNDDNAKDRRIVTLVRRMEGSRNVTKASVRELAHVRDYDIDRLNVAGTIVDYQDGHGWRVDERKVPAHVPPPTGPYSQNTAQKAAL